MEAITFLEQVQAFNRTQRWIGKEVRRWVARRGSKRRTAALEELRRRAGALEREYERWLGTIEEG